MALLNKNNIPYFKLHISVFIFGFTAILGKLISVNHFSLVWNRMWIALPIFFLIPGFLAKLRKQNLRQWLIYLGIGCLVALHWITFYGSIKIGNSASLTLACLGLSACFTSVLEPLFTRTKFKTTELFLGLVALAGMLFIFFSNQNDDPAQNQRFYLAILWGIITTLLASIFSVLNAKFAKKDQPNVMSFTELLGGFLFLTVCFFVMNKFTAIKNLLQIDHTTLTISNSLDWIWLILLGVFCTTFAFVLNVTAMKSVSAFTANIAIGLEPVYGILLAFLIFGEGTQFNTNFYIGISLILTTIIIQTYFNLKKKRL